MTNPDTTTPDPADTDLVDNIHKVETPSGTTEPAATPPDETTADLHASQPEPEDGPGREAAKYRRQLREAEAERDTLRQQVTDLTRQQIASAAGVTVDEVVGDTPEAMQASASAFQERVSSGVEAELRRRGRHAAAPVSMVTDGAEKPPMHTPEPQTWTDLLQQGRDTRQ